MCVFEREIAFSEVSCLAFVRADGFSVLLEEGDLFERIFLNERLGICNVDQIGVDLRLLSFGEKKIAFIYFSQT